MIYSLVGFCATFYIIFLTILQYIKLDNQNVVIKTEPKTWAEIFYITPVLCFAYQVFNHSLLFSMTFCKT